MLDGDPASPERKGTATPPSFWPMSIVATVAISATAEILFSELSVAAYVQGPLKTAVAIHRLK